MALNNTAINPGNGGPLVSTEDISGISTYGSTTTSGTGTVSTSSFSLGVSSITNFSSGYVWLWSDNVSNWVLVNYTGASGGNLTGCTVDALTAVSGPSNAAPTWASGAKVVQATLQMPRSKIVTGGSGTDGGDVSVSNPLYTAHTDGSNGTVAVKAASTAAAASDIALVVSLSPNSPVKATIKPLYGSNNQTITITLNSLASAAARQSTVVDNTSNLFEDVHIFVKIKTAASSVSATGYVNIYGYGTADNGTTYPEGVSGSDGSITLASPSNLVFLAQLTANANATTYSAIFSFCNTYGLVRLFPKWGIVVSNQTGAALDSTAGNFAVFYQGINGQLV